MLKWIEGNFSRLMEIKIRTDENFECSLPSVVALEANDPFKWKTQPESFTKIFSLDHFLKMLFSLPSLMSFYDWFIPETFHCLAILISTRKRRRRTNVARDRIKVNKWKSSSVSAIASVPDVDILTNVFLSFLKSSSLKVFEGEEAEGNPVFQFLFKF